MKGRLVALGLVLAGTVALASAQQTDRRVYGSKEPGVTLPTVVHAEKPAYTEAAMAARIQGAMTVSAVVEADGTVGDVAVLQSLDQTYGLDEQGVKAAKATTFKPGRKDGEAVAVRIEMLFRFTLQ